MLYPQIVLESKKNSSELVKSVAKIDLDEIYAYQFGQVYSEYPIIALFMEKVQIHDKDGKRVICDYEELKGWWQNV